MSDVNLFELWTYLISFRIPEEFFKVLEYPERVTAEEKVSCRKFTLTLLLCMLPRCQTPRNPCSPTRSSEQIKIKSKSKILPLRREGEKPRLKVQTPKNVQMNKANTHFELPNPNARA
jgi:hypothetical protein